MVVDGDKHVLVAIALLLQLRAGCSHTLFAHVHAFTVRGVRVDVDTTQPDDRNTDEDEDDDYYDCHEHSKHLAEAV